MKSPVIRIAGAAGLLIVVAAASSLCGATAISPHTAIAALFDPSAADSTERVILLQLRLPRILAGALVGGCLAAAGVGFQGLFRNPLAEPFVIGASSGAALGVAVVIVAGWQATLWSLGATTLMAMLGSVAVVMTVLVIGALARTTSTISLLLAGVVISCMVNAVVSALMFLFDQKAVVILSWLMGSLASTHWPAALMVGVIGGLGILGIAALARPLDAFTLGDTASQSLGLDLRRFRSLVIAAASMATAAAVAASGVIGFVGLISPHIARALVGPRHAVLIPMSVLVGAGLLVLADVVARTIIAPAELPVGIVTAILGCPFFLFLLLTDRRGMTQSGAAS
ncbi:FecCD family ABC transporter permease [Roseimaritima sediminicola]|uniref:FecCD family ABC transporter permease n=1 Tax=Roseimaritima sediminicola TaxID=2662066 RepID=UPI001386D5E7|nr:iron ABC transporter permease [Roseimaritima sediminicola]